MKIERELKTAVLIIGGGGAGLRAALAAAEAGSEVLVVSKGPIGKSGITLTAAGGMQAPLTAADSAETYFRDTVECGYRLGDENLARILAEGACQQVTDLERYGVRFLCHDDGGYNLRQFPGQSVARNLFIQGGGIGLVAALAAACRRHDRVTLMDDFVVTGLVKDGTGAVAGAVGLNLKTGELTLIEAQATVMATGGCQWLWEVNDCPADATGDGIIHAYRAGAELVDMEMVLFYPSIIVWPPSLQGAFVHYEYLSADLLDGNVYDKQGKPVLPKPLPVRDQSMRMMAEALQQGRGDDHGGLLWYVGDSMKHPRFVEATLASLQYDYIRAHGVNPATDRIAVAPGAHYLMGGIFIDDRCQTTVPGLFATPECAGNFDGANRLAGSGITATQVFGAHSGLQAHRWATEKGPASADRASVEEEERRIAAKLSPSAGTSHLAALGKQLRRGVQDHGGIVRSGQGLEQLRSLADSIKQEAADLTVPISLHYNQRLLDLLQLETMAEAAALIASSAMAREESRGHHYRSDFPATSDSWLRHTTVMREGGMPRMGTRAVIRV